MMTAGYPDQAGSGAAPQAPPPTHSTSAPSSAPSNGASPPAAPSNGLSPQQGPQGAGALDPCIGGPNGAGGAPLPPDHHPNMGGYHDQAQFETDKRSVYKWVPYHFIKVLYYR